jgi:hypothetical protein
VRETKNEEKGSKCALSASGRPCRAETREGKAFSRHHRDYAIQNNALL